MQTLWRLLTGGLFALLLLSGCVPVVRPDPGPLADVGQDSINSSRLSCFLTLRESEGPAVRLEITAIEVLAGELWLPLASKPVVADAADIGAGQIFLAGRALPPGNYQRLRLTVGKGSLRQPGGGDVTLVADPLVIEVHMPAPLQLEAGDSRVLLVTWDVQNSLSPDNSLHPDFTIAAQLRQLLADLIYVACPEIDTVYLVRADRNWVVDAFGVTGRPAWLALDPARRRDRLYVLAAGEATVKVVDLASHRVVDFFPVPLNDVPTYMTISPDGRWAYLVDERSGYLSRMDLTNGRTVTRVRLGYRPHYATFLEGQNLLAVSLSLSQSAVLLDPLSLAVVRSVTTGSTPQGLLAAGTEFYIADSADHMVSIVDLNGQRGVHRVSVGLGPRRLAATESFVYVSNSEGGTLSVLAPGLLGVLRDISGFGRPTEMAYDRFYRRLFIADEVLAALVVVDSNSNLLTGRIALGARPSGLAILQ